MTRENNCSLCFFIFVCLLSGRCGMVVKTVRSCFGWFFLSAIPLPRSNFRPPLFLLRRPSSSSFVPLRPPPPLPAAKPTTQPEKEGEEDLISSNKGFLLLPLPSPLYVLPRSGKNWRRRVKKCNSLSCCLLFPTQREKDCSTLR